MYTAVHITLGWHVDEFPLPFFSSDKTVCVCACWLYLFAFWKSSLSISFYYFVLALFTFLHIFYYILYSFRSFVYRDSLQRAWRSPSIILTSTIFGLYSQPNHQRQRNYPESTKPPIRNSLYSASISASVSVSISSRHLWTHYYQDAFQWTHPCHFGHSCCRCSYQQRLQWCLQLWLESRGVLLQG